MPHPEVIPHPPACKALTLQSRRTKKSKWVRQTLCWLISWRLFGQTLTDAGFECFWLTREAERQGMHGSSKWEEHQFNQLQFNIVCFWQSKSGSTCSPSLYEFHCPLFECTPQQHLQYSSPLSTSSSSSSCYLPVGENHWCWCHVTQSVSLFHIAHSQHFEDVVY